MSDPVLQVITSTTRPGRNGRAVADWFCGAAREHGGFTVELLDLAEIGLPLMDEPNQPHLQKYTQEHTRNWSETIARGDAFVFVLAEYNFGYPAPLKNAIDYLYLEWNNKPAGVVSYGGVSGGLRASQSLRSVLASIRVLPTYSSVTIPMVFGMLSDGVLNPTEPVAASATSLLNELQSKMPASRLLREPN